MRIVEVLLVDDTSLVRKQVPSTEREVSGRPIGRRYRVLHFDAEQGIEAHRRAREALE